MKRMTAVAMAAGVVMVTGDSRHQHVNLTGAVLQATTRDTSAVDRPSTIVDYPCPSNRALRCVMSGLDNPRGLAFGPEGALYVAEAGRGGPSTPGPCVVAGNRLCYGPTGAVTRLWNGAQERIVTGLPSIAQVGNPGIPDGTRAEGPNDISLLGLGEAYVTIGLENNPRAFRTAWGSVGDGFGQLVRLHWPAQGRAQGAWTFVADLAAFEEANDPDHDLYSPLEAITSNSNPFGLLALPGERIIADAGGNDIVRVDAAGAISLVAVMPRVPCVPGFCFCSATEHLICSAANDGSAVPTSIAVGPDGAWYIGQLTGVPAPFGAASIYRLVPGHDPVPFLTGFKAIIDIAFDHEGNLYVVQHSISRTTAFMPPGNLLRVASDGTRTEIIGGLDRPTSVAIGPDGALYVTNHGLSSGNGEVLRIVP